MKWVTQKLALGSWLLIQLQEEKEEEGEEGERGNVVKYENGYCKEARMAWNSQLL